MQLSATEVRVLSRLIDRTLALPPGQREAYLAALPGPQQALVPRIRERLAQLALTEFEAEVAVAPPPPPPRAQRLEVRVGPYRLVEPLNGSERARVWRAERADRAVRADRADRVDSTARKAFALCLPQATDPEAAADGAPDARQLAAERQVVLLPEHPQTVRLIDAGIDAEGRFYRVLPFVEGLGLVMHAQRRGLGLHKLVALMTEASRLVAHVHEGDVACTALGPAILRVDDEGRVRLLDWGRGRSLRPDTRAADIRALGALLQALLAGDAEQAASDASSALPKPAPLRPVPLRPAPAGPVAPGPDVAHILRRALQAHAVAGVPNLPKAVAPPYPTVAALIDDLELVLGWRPVPGAGGDALHRARLWLRRHRMRLALGAVGAALVLSVAWAGWQTLQRSQGQTQRADAARVFLQQHLPETLPDALPDATPLTGRHDLAVEAPRVQQALDAARTGFAGEPVLRGQVITALGVRLRVLGLGDQALTVSQEAVTLLQATSRADEPALGDARAELARQHMLEGSVAGQARAAALAQQVLATCTASACAAGRSAAQQLLQQLQQKQQQQRQQKPPAGS